MNRNRMLWILVIVLAIIGVVIVFRRVLFIIPILQNGNSVSSNVIKNTSPIPDAGFAKHPLLTLIHILPGFLFMILGPLQFSKKIRFQRPNLHRWIGRVYLACGLVIGISALFMSFLMSIGGVNETVATTLFALFFLFGLIKAYIHIRKRQILLHREWMLRAFAIGLAVSTTRPIVGIFVATSGFTKLTVEEYFGTAFWLAFTLHLMIAELWINHTRTRKGIDRLVQ